MPEELLSELQSLITEGRNPDSERLDMMSTSEILETMNHEDASVPAAVKRVIPDIEKAVEIIVEAIRSGGRVFFIGAGTSGRLGGLDGVGWPPAVGSGPAAGQGVFAGGCIGAGEGG